YRMCDLPSFVVTIDDLTAVPCNGYSSPPSITMTPIVCCRDCYSINLPFTDVKYLDVVFPTGENEEIDGYGNMTGMLGGFFLPIGSTFGVSPAFDGCCYNGSFSSPAGVAQASFSMCYMQSSNQAIMRVVLLNVVRGSGGQAVRWYVCNNFDPSVGGDFYLSLVLDDGGYAALADSNWRTAWNNVSTFNAAYPNGDFSNILSDTWPNKISAGAPSSCYGYSYSPPPPACSGNCFYAAFDIAPEGWPGGEFLVWFEVFSGTGFPGAAPPPWPTCGAGCGCFPFTSPTTVPFDATTYSQYLTFCNLYSYPSYAGETLETECV
ncbi:MAG: hypothetical protein WCH39_14675, partial [Schlesneria sp.]